MNLEEGQIKDENKQKKNNWVSKIIQKQIHPSLLPSLAYGRRALKDTMKTESYEDSVDSMIDAIIMNDNIEAQDIFKNILHDRIADALEDKRQEIAQNLYQSNQD